MGPRTQLVSTRQPSTPAVFSRQTGAHLQMQQSSSLLLCSPVKYTPSPNKHSQSCNTEVFVCFLTAALIFLPITSHASTIFFISVHRFCVSSCFINQRSCLYLNFYKKLEKTNTNKQTITIASALQRNLHLELAISN